jgi:hypothetical protein
MICVSYVTVMSRNNECEGLIILSRNHSDEIYIRREYSQNIVTTSIITADLPEPLIEHTQRYSPAVQQEDQVFVQAALKAIERTRRVHKLHTDGG